MRRTILNFIHTLLKDLDVDTATNTSLDWRPTRSQQLRNDNYFLIDETLMFLESHQTICPEERGVTFLSPLILTHRSFVFIFLVRMRHSRETQRLLMLTVPREIWRCVLIRNTDFPFSSNNLLYLVFIHTLLQL